MTHKTPRELLREIAEVYRADYRGEGKKESNQTMIAGTMIIMCLVCLSMSIMNHVVKAKSMEIATVILAITFLINAILELKTGRDRCVCTLANFAVCGMFTFFLIIGGNDGFAASWILLLPIVNSCIFGLCACSIVSAYFSFIVFALFWTPVGVLLQYQYTDTFMLRFPMLLLCCCLSSTYFGYQMQKSRRSEYRHKTELENSVREERERVANISLEVIESMNRAVESKNPYTQQHAQRVADYSMEIARALGWDEPQCKKLWRTALLHDVGKIGIPDNILNKTSGLTDEEYALIKTHPTIGQKILQPLQALEMIDRAACCHHERYDGTGYPNGLAGEEIPIEARIVCVADSIDSMHSDRPYRSGMVREDVIAELQKNAGKQFDPQLAEIAVQLIKSNVIDCGRKGA